MACLDLTFILKATKDFKWEEDKITSVRLRDNSDRKVESSWMEEKRYTGKEQRICRVGSS